jgi:hypothetical protein
MCVSPPLARSVRTFALVDSDGEPAVSVSVPDGLSRLVPATRDTRARCEPARAGGSRATASCLVEPVDLGTGPALLVLAPDHRRIRVNGQRLARIATVEESDTIQIDGGQTFHVALHTECTIGLVPEEQRDVACAVCRLPLGKHHIYLCPRCRAAIHADEHGPEGEEALDCLALLSECPRCRALLARGARAATPEGST